jgi:hypothetical protein
MDKYYTDAEIIELIQETILNDADAHRIACIVEERFEQKDNLRDCLRGRLDVAATYIGHTVITESMEDY